MKTILNNKKELYSTCEELCEEMITMDSSSMYILTSYFFDKKLKIKLKWLLEKFINMNVYVSKHIVRYNCIN